MKSDERPPKLDAFLALLRQGWTSLHIDARRPGVVVPAHLRGEAHLVLQYGHDLPIPIPDLQADEQGVRATLSFSRSPCTTVIPWSAVYVVRSDDGQGVLYQEDVPDDLDQHVPAQTTAALVQATVATAPRSLRSVPAEVDRRDLTPSPIAPRRRRKPQLRLVK